MTLEIYKILNEIDQAVEVIAERRVEYEKLVQLGLEKLRAYSDNLELLEAKVRIARRKLDENWRGAVPAGEPIASVFDPPTDLEPVRHVIAADGSQIFPDRHGIAHYALINIGTFHIQPGSGLTPRARTIPGLIYGPRLLDDEQIESLQAADISRDRDKQELSLLIDLGSKQTGATVALLDSPLLLWILGQTDPGAVIKRWFIEQLESAERIGLLLAGYVDRPGSRGVADLLALASLPDENIIRGEPALSLFKDMPDRLIFEAILAPGQRSALFSSDSPINRELKKQKIAFFYVNMGTPGEPAVARVETPFWVAGDPQRLGQLHTAIWDQCQSLPGYPYALSRAHEIAVVTQEHRRELETMIAGAMLGRGLAPKASAKAIFKNFTG